MIRGGERLAALALAVVVAATATLFGAPAAYAAPGVGVAAGSAQAMPAQAPGDLCSVEEWATNWRKCKDKLLGKADDVATCTEAPTPSTPDSGLPGWFASRPSVDPKNNIAGLYSTYGYAGYNFSNGNTGCLSTVAFDNKIETTVANWEFMIATAIIGASNALRERAWSPRSMWGWADTLVEDATTALYKRVFTVFGIISLGVVGLYLLWRSRQSDMSNAVTTAGWAILVMVAVSAVALWPVRAANLADGTLTTTLGVVHDAVGPRQVKPDANACLDPNGCEDLRPPAVRASDMVTDTLLYRNWLRGMLGSADSDIAKKYGHVLYDAKSLSWEETEFVRAHPDQRDALYASKKRQWSKFVDQIKVEDPEAYEYLTGQKSTELVGAGFIAILAALFFALFDITASILVLLGFLIFRWAIIAAPILGTLGLLRPASAGLRRLANAVVAAIFNIAIFGTGAAVYLFAVDVIMGTTSLPGWLQVVLVWLCGIVGWLLLRPYRRITQLGGKDSSATVAEPGSWHRRFLLGDPRPGRTRPEPVQINQRQRIDVVIRDERPEARPDSAAEPSPGTPATSPDRAGEPARQSTPARRADRWVEPDVPNTTTTSYTIYRPDSIEPTESGQPERVRAEAR